MMNQNNSNKKHIKWGFGTSYELEVTLFGDHEKVQQLEIHLV